MLFYYEMQIPPFKYTVTVNGLCFLPHDTMRKCGLCCCPVSVCHVGGLYPDG